MKMERLKETLLSALEGCDNRKAEACADALAEAMCALEGCAPERYAEIAGRLHVALYGRHFDEATARAAVSEMMHTDRHGAEHVGEHYTSAFAEEVRDKHLPDAEPWDVYVALNATWHDFAALFGEWFSAPADSHFVKTAVAFWFDDEDYGSDTKVWDYFN